MAGVGGRGEAATGTNHSYSRRLRRRGQLRSSDRKSAWSACHRATASTANQDILKQLGADVAVDYTKTKFEDVARDVDAVLDPVGKETLARSYGVVKKGGIVMSLVARPDPAELKKHGIRGTGISSHPDAKDLA